MGPLGWGSGQPQSNSSMRAVIILHIFCNKFNLGYLEQRSWSKVRNRLFPLIAGLGLLVGVRWLCLRILWLPH